VLEPSVLYRCFVLRLCAQLVLCVVPYLLCAQDVLAVLQVRTAAAALMRAACTTAASLMVHLTDAEAKPLQACSLLDALVCE